MTANIDLLMISPRAVTLWSLKDTLRVWTHLAVAAHEGSFGSSAGGVASQSLRAVASYAHDGAGQLDREVREEKQQGAPAQALSALGHVLAALVVEGP